MVDRVADHKITDLATLLPWNWLRHLCPRRCLTCAGAQAFGHSRGGRNTEIHAAAPSVARRSSVQTLTMSRKFHRKPLARNGVTLAARSPAVARPSYTTSREIDRSLSSETSTRNLRSQHQRNRSSPF